MNPKRTDYDDLPAFINDALYTDSIDQPCDPGEFVVCANAVCYVLCDAFLQSGKDLSKYGHFEHDGANVGQQFRVFMKNYGTHANGVNEIFLKLNLPDISVAGFLADACLTHIRMLRETGYFEEESRARLRIGSAIPFNGFSNDRTLVSHSGQVKQELFESAKNLIGLSLTLDDPNFLYILNNLLGCAQMNSSIRN